MTLICLIGGNEVFPPSRDLEKLDIPVIDWDAAQSKNEFFVSVAGPSVEPFLLNSTMDEMICKRNHKLNYGYEIKSSYDPHNYYERRKLRL